MIGETAQTLTDIIDTTRSLRLEMMIVLLIVFEIGITFFQIFTGDGTLTSSRPSELAKQANASRDRPEIN